MPPLDVFEEGVEERCVGHDASAEDFNRRPLRIDVLSLMDPILSTGPLMCLPSDDGDNNNKSTDAEEQDERQPPTYVSVSAINAEPMNGSTGAPYAAGYQQLVGRDVILVKLRHGKILGGSVGLGGGAMDLGGIEDEGDGDAGCASSERKESECHVGVIGVPGAMAGCVRFAARKQAIAAPEEDEGATDAGDGDAEFHVRRQRHDYRRGIGRVCVPGRTEIVFLGGKGDLEDCGDDVDALLEAARRGESMGSETQREPERGYRGAN
ncbi:hypothetical protein ACJZ2D_008329 [Fusarium nematophilum]